MVVSKRRYAMADVISFAKTTARYGGLSNMAPKYPLFVNEVFIQVSVYIRLANFLFILRFKRKSLSNAIQW